ncbi:hypothetical protein ACIP46_38730 [Streptomyces lavendulae]|uniref:hypothetical protein n=1 Tax=Streptomyces lavendulae TaxID=1914 RepID=UPI00382787A1
MIDFSGAPQRIHVGGERGQDLLAKPVWQMQPYFDEGASVWQPLDAALPFHSGGGTDGLHLEELVTSWQRSSLHPLGPQGKCSSATCDEQLGRLHRYRLAVPAPLFWTDDSTFRADVGEPELVE